MYHIHPDTIAAYKGRALQQPVDSSLVSVEQTVTMMNEYFKQQSDELADVEESALLFYMLNHANALVFKKYDPDEILPEEVLYILNAYQQYAAQITQRCMYYVLLIVTRESRHTHKSDNKYLGVMKKYGKIFEQWHREMPNGSSAAATYLRQYPVELFLGDYISAITMMFNNCGYSGGYGGKPWANIATTLKNLVFGVTSPEVFTDTAWTLAHNNGPMFNKGMLYQSYTSELIKILDVQRSGQIPQLIASSGVSIPSTVNNLFEKCRIVFPKEFSGQVDWHLVEDLGAVKKYSKEKKVQKQMPEIPNVPKLYVTNTEYALVTQRKKVA